MLTIVYLDIMRPPLQSQTIEFMFAGMLPMSKPYTGGDIIEGLLSHYDLRIGDDIRLRVRNPHTGRFKWIDGRLTDLYKARRGMQETRLVIKLSNEEGTVLRWTYKQLSDCLQLHQPRSMVPARGSSVRYLSSDMMLRG